jgi:Fic family protein
MFKPVFSITPQTSQYLMQLERLRYEIQNLPITPTVLTSLRESARLHTVHYSTAIEGNRLSLEQIEGIVQGEGTPFPGRERDVSEVLGYYAALEKIKTIALPQHLLMEKDIQTFFALTPRAARALCHKWLQSGFLVIKDSAKKTRTYQLHPDLDAKLF